MGGSAYPPPPSMAASIPPPPPGYGRHGPPPSRHSSHPPPRASQPSPSPGPQEVPLERVVDDVAAMGFSRERVRSVLRDLADSGQSIDLNVVLDRLAR